MDEVGIWSRVLTEAEILGLAGRDLVGAPVIVSAPQPVTRYVGATATFAVDATGKRPVSYEWSKDGGTTLSFHGTVVSVLDAAGNLLQQLSAQTGTVGDYTARTLPLPPQLLGQSIILEFRFYCDSVVADPVTGAPFEGWYVDDAQLLPQ